MTGPVSSAPGNRGRVTGNPHIAEYAAIGSRAARRARLTLTRVEAELGQLETLEDAQRWLRLVILWTSAKMLPGAAASSIVKGVDIWVRAEAAKVTRNLVEETQRKHRDLEAQLVELRRQVAQ